jgi:type IV pilus assembly protein PilB
VDSVRYAEVIAGDGAGEGDVTGVAQVYSLLVGAFREEATEVHLEPQRQDIRVRYRVDGQLVERPRLARAALGPVLFRFRILAGLRGASLPASAHLRTRLEDQDVELDILFYPTLYGEAVTVSLWRRRPEAPALESLELSPAVLDAIPRLLAAEGGLVFVTGWEARARAVLLYAMAGAAAGPARKVLTLERAVSYVVPEFVQVEAPEDFARVAATILAQPVDVALVEDVGEQPVCLAAFGSAERGTLVLAGLGFATSDTGLGHLLTLDVPRFPLLAQIRGFVDVRQRGARYWADVRLMTDELRQELMDQKHGHR